MTLEYQIPLVSFIFILILNIVYFSKKKVSLIENKPYYIILICSLIVSIIDTILHIISAKCNSIELVKYYPLIVLSNKILSSLFVVIFSSLLFYVLLISYEKVRKNFQKTFLSFFLFDTVAIFIIFLLKVEIIEAVTARNVGGSAITLGYIIVGLLLIIASIVSFINFKKDDKRYWAVFMILFMIIILYFLTILFPGIIIYDLILALICYIMYFTIENPDVKMVQKLTLARDIAEKANNAKSDFLSSMSHEIRTPLNAIVGLSEDMKNYQENLPKEVVEDIEDIEIASQNLLEIVGNILDFNKIESGKMEISESPYNLKEEVEKLIKINKTRIGDKPLTLNAIIESNVPIHLIGDKIHIKTIINNFLTNAIKYTESGTVTLNISSEKETTNKIKLKISVSDTGKGITEENLQKLGGKFERLDTEINSTIEGTGLGLAITKNLVNMMGGTIEVESKVNIGSTFTVIIPQEIEEIKELQKEEIQEETVVSNNESRKILIVDDSELNLKVAKKNIENLGYQVETVTSGVDCLEKLMSGNNFDLILMDIMMPEMDGIETLKKMIEMNIEIPVIALTADAIAGAEEKYKNEGFVDYVSKPFKKEEIKEKIEKHIQ